MLFFIEGIKLTSKMNRKEKIVTLLKGIETGDAKAADAVNAEKYIQHNPQTKEGGEGLAALFKRLSKSSPRVNIVRIFEDGDYVFGHTEYEFSTSRVGFEVFRFEGDHAVEHWDNIQPRKGPNLSGHSMVSGVTVSCEHEKTESNRSFISSFIDKVLIKREFRFLVDYIQSEKYTEHNPRISDGVDSLKFELSTRLDNERFLIEYDKIHRVLADGNFVLSVCEGYFNGVHTSFYDLFRIENEKIVEHWDTTEAVAPREQWKNDNGKF